MRYHAHVRIACPACGVGVVDTAHALSTRQIPHGLQWVGVPCSRCAKTFTLDALHDAHSRGLSG